MSDDIRAWGVDLERYATALVWRRADAVEADVVALVDFLSDEVAQWMRDNARWQDRSGDARAGLWADVEHMLHDSVTLLMSHDVTLDYTWFLEANPSFAVLGDAADFIYPMLRQGVTEIVRRHSS